MHNTLDGDKHREESRNRGRKRGLRKVTSEQGPRRMRRRAGRYKEHSSRRDAGTMAIRCLQPYMVFFQCFILIFSVLTLSPKLRRENPSLSYNFQMFELQYVWLPSLGLSSWGHSCGVRFCGIFHLASRGSSHVLWFPSPYIFLTKMKMTIRPYTS